MSTPLKDSETLKNFRIELFELFEKYNVSLSHEDEQGAFIIEEFNQKNINWLDDARVKL